MFSKKPIITNKDIIANILKIPSDQFKVYDKESKEYTQAKDLEKKQQVLNEQKKNTFSQSASQLEPLSISPPNNNEKSSTDKMDVATSEIDNDTSAENNQKTTEPIPTNYSFDSTIDVNLQNTIQGLLNELNIVLRLPDLNLSTNKTINEEGEPGVVTIVETTVNESDNSEKQQVEKLMIEPFIVVENQ